MAPILPPTEGVSNPPALSVPAIFAVARMIEAIGQNRTESGTEMAGCYICQPNNPNAAEEGCGACDADYWTAEIARLRREDPPSDPDCYCGLHCFIGRGCHLCSECGRPDGPYLNAERPTPGAPIASGCPKCGWCL